jgi:excisionase family DNA binding protein
MASNIKLQKNCVYCGREYTAKTLHTRYCSHKCNSKHYKKVKREERISEALSKSDDSKKCDINASHVSVGEKDFLSIQETALLIGTSKRTVERLIKNGELQIKKIGRRTIIHRNFINQLFKI